MVLPGGGSRQRVLVVLGQLKLRLYPLPPKSGASVDPYALDVAALGKPTLSLAADKCLYRKSADRLKRDCIEIVIMKQKKGKLAGQLAMFEQNASEDVLELYAGSPTETRNWLATMHNPRYLAARGMHLISAVEGKTGPPRKTDLWAKYAHVNQPDKRREGLLALAIRGVEVGDEAGRCRLLAWLLDVGAECLPFGEGTAGEAKEASAKLRRASSVGLRTPRGGGGGGGGAATSRRRRCRRRAARSACSSSSPRRRRAATRPTRPGRPSSPSCSTARSPSTAPPRSTFSARCAKRTAAGSRTCR